MVSVQNGASQHSSTEGEGHTNPHSYLKSYRHLMLLEEEELVFLRVLWYPVVMAPSMCIVAALTGFSRQERVCVREKENESEKGIQRGIWNWKREVGGI